MDDPSKARKETETVYVDRIDNVLPKDAVIDFMLMDVQYLEVACLEGMKETIMRSPNIVMYVEWSGRTPDFTDIRDRRNQLLDWFVDLEFKFYLPGPIGCGSIKLVEWTVDQVKAIDDENKLQDIIFIPSHIDPNKDFP